VIPVHSENGSSETVAHARARGIHVVHPDWLRNCLRYLRRMDEAEYRFVEVLPAAPFQVRSRFA
jgi:hypothetical protein